MYIYIYTYMYIYTCIYVYMYVNIYIFTYMCICIHIYINIHIYVSRSTGPIFSPGQGAGLLIHFFLSLVLKNQPNPWTKQTVSTRLTTQTHETVPDQRPRGRPKFRADLSSPLQDGTTVHNVGGLACILWLANSHNQSP